MKLFNSILFSSAIIAVFGLSSCTKEYTCQCTISYSGVAGLPDTSVNEYSVRDTKKGAKSVCESKSNTTTSGNVKTVETCRLF
jgi:hypothetical protein